MIIDEVIQKLKDSSIADGVLETLRRRCAAAKIQQKYKQGSLDFVDKLLYAHALGRFVDASRLRLYATYFYGKSKQVPRSICGYAVFDFSDRFLGYLNKCVKLGYAKKLVRNKHQYFKSIPFAERIN